VAAPAARRLVTPRFGIASVFLLATLGFFGLTTVLPWEFALVLVAAGGAAAIALRVASAGGRTNSAAIVVLVVIGILAAGAPDAWLAGVAGGASVLALLAWLADDPGRVAGSMRRAVPTLAVAGLAFLVAWGSAFLLPTSQVPTGVIAALLVGVLLIATLLLARPDVLEREAPLSA